MNDLMKITDGQEMKLPVMKNCIYPGGGNICGVLVKQEIE